MVEGCDDVLPGLIECSNAVFRSIRARFRIHADRVIDCFSARSMDRAVKATQPVERVRFIIGRNWPATNCGAGRILIESARRSGVIIENGAWREQEVEDGRGDIEWIEFTLRVKIRYQSFHIPLRNN